MASGSAASDAVDAKPVQTVEATAIAEQPKSSGVPEQDGQVEGQQVEEGAEYAIEERMIEINPITIRLPSPSHAQTLPPLPNAATTSKSSKSAPTYPSTLTIHPQPSETIQDIRATIAEWPGGYWLGPYSLRVPGEEVQEGRGKILGIAKEGLEVREGEKLSDWLEVGEVFSHLEKSDEEKAEEKVAEKVAENAAGEPERVLIVQQEPYSEQDARQAFLRLREYTIATNEASQPFVPIGVNPGPSIFEGIRDGTVFDPEVKIAETTEVNGKAVKKSSAKAKKPPTIEPKAEDAPFNSWKGWPSTDIARIPTSLPPVPHAQCVRSLLFSPFNPPPPHLRQRGHLVYLTVVTLEGESAMLVCTTRGWHVARTASPSSVFDPAPRVAPKSISAHSLIDVLHGLSPLFTSTLRSLQSHLSVEPAREPIATVPIPQYPPAYPWLVSAPSEKSIHPDAQRMQLAYGYTGATTVDGLEGARDWNEEIQNARELPRSSTQERILRERVLQKTHAEFTAASVRAVIAIARGDYPPINPHEDPKAHMHLIANIFVTKAVNSVDAYTHLGGDEAAHVSHAKDASGVRLLNKLDIDNVYLLGHTVVDWQGERWVCQSVLPGIFSRKRDDNEGLEDEEEIREGETAAAESEKKEEWVEVDGTSPKVEQNAKIDESGESADEAAGESENYLIIYGADSEGGLSHLHWDAGMHKVMKKIASAQRLALHKMQSTQGEEHEFWTSVDVKGLRGSDGRRYLLDLPRLSPVDVEWLEKDMGEGEENYPHRVVLLRPELIETFWEHSLKVWARQVQSEKAEKEKAEKEKAEKEAASPEGTKTDGEASTIKEASDLPQKFELRFNADAFVEQPKAFGDAKAASDGLSYVPESQKDESDPSIKAVRNASVFLRNIAVPAMLIDIVTSNSFGVMDGASLSKQMHVRGINMRYLGLLMQTIEKTLAGPEVEAVGLLKAMRTIVQQEMVFRAAKHVLRRLLHGLLAEHQICAVSHFLNCLLGAQRNAHPTATYEPLTFVKSAEPAYLKLTPESLQREIVREVERRFRWKLEEDYLVSGLKRPQLLRELATRSAFQIQQRQYYFGSIEGDDVTSSANSEEDKENVAPKQTRKLKAPRVVDEASTRANTFEPSDIVAMLPVIKSCAPTATVAEELFQTGHNTINHGNVSVGLELMLEGINYYEQIHSVVHPEVAAAYNQYAVLMHSLVRLRLQQIAAESPEADPPLGLDLTTAIRLQKQAVMAAERTLGLGHPETISYYFNLAMLEHLHGDHLAAMRYLKHDIALWDMAYGSDHPELANLLSNVAAVLQAAGQNGACIAVLNDVHRLNIDLFGEGHVVCANSLSQLTQAHFLGGDIKSAADSAKAASDIYTKQLGAEDAQAKDAAKNAELLASAVEQRSNQQQQQQEQQEQQQQLSVLQRLQIQRQQSLLAGQRNRLDGSATASSSRLAETVSAPQQGSAAMDPRIGEKGHMDVDSLVKFIQGSQSGSTSSNKTKGKNALRGKKRTGAKR